ncbi:MAG: hypothetical protein U1E28_22975 [Beijerinckiaceae bacterium]
MTNNPIKLVASSSVALTSAPAIFSHAESKPVIVRVWSNRQFHVAIGDSADANALPVAAGGEGALIHVDAAEDMSAVKGAAEDDGEVWFSVVRRY